MDAFELIVVSLADWMNRQQQRVIEHLQRETRNRLHAQPVENGKDTARPAPCRAWRSQFGDRFCV